VIYTAKGNNDGKNKAADKLTPPLTPGPKAADKPYPDIYNTDEYLFPAGPYYNVRAGRTRLGDREMVVGEVKQEKRREVGFDLAGDGRVRQTVLRHRMDVMLNVSCSFDPATMTCSGCKERGVHSMVRGDRGEPVVLVFTDQNFPAVLYSEDKEQCIGVVRAEHGTIREIGFMVTDMLDGVTLAPGSVILVGSVSDLAKQGVSGYSEELARTVRILREKLGPNAQVGIVPPILLGGVNSFNLLRGIVEMESWVERLEGGEGALLQRTRAEVIKRMWDGGVGKRRSVEERLHTVPRGVEGFEKVYMRCTGWSGMPERVGPLSSEGEAAIVGQLVGELRSSFGVRVSQRLVMDRENVEAVVENEYVVWGSSNGGRLADVMVKMGFKVVKVTEGGWRPNKVSVAKMMKEMEGKVNPGATLIMMGLDNGMYYGEQEDGGRALPKQGEDKKFHVEGRVEVGTRKQAKGLLGHCLPILDRYERNRKVLLSPSVRWFRRRCCDCEEHCTNFCLAGYRKGMLADLSEVKDAMMELCRDEGMQMYKVMSTCELLGLRAAMEEDEVERILGTDPVHMTEDGFVTLAENLIRTLDNPATLFAGEKRSREEQVEGGVVGSWRRKTHEWLYNTVSGTGARSDNRGTGRVTVPVSLPSLVPSSSGARSSTSGGGMNTGGGRWSNNY
jgi:hypothetical protein